MAIRINLGTLKEGSQVIELDTDAHELGLDKSLLKDRLHVVLDISKTSNQIDIKLNLTGILMPECDRCLEIFEMPLNLDHELVFIQKSAREEKIDIDSQDDYLKFYSPFMKSVDITNDIREFVLLAIPMRKVPEWKDGKCTWCGRNEEYFKQFLASRDEEE
jgi:uncharacterized metal-binding protein YceD (DUF177 family)